MKYFLPLVVAAVLTTIALGFSEGFSPSKILCDLELAEETDSLPSFAESYRYLSHGRQCFVFESPDQKTVIKFFNQNYIRPHWYHSLPAPQGWKEREEKKIALRRKFYRESYLLAMRELREESGLLYVHLLKSAKPLPSVTLIDPTGRSIVVDLNRTAFVLQKKAQPYLAHLKEVKQKEGALGLRREIDDLIRFVSSRIDKRIADYDHDIDKNLGYLDGRILFIDPGRFFKDEQLAEEKRGLMERWKAVHRLHKWLLKIDPDAANYLGIFRTSWLPDRRQSPTSPVLQTGG